MRRSARSSAAATPSAEDQHSARSPSSQKRAVTSAAKPTRAASRSKKTKTEAADEEEKEQNRSDAEDTAAAAEDEPRAKRRHASDAAHSSSSSAAAASSSSAASAAAAMPSPSDDDADVGAEDDPAADDLEAQAAAAGVSVYEYNRQLNIRLKNEQLQALNLAGMASDIGLRRAAPAPRSSSKRKSREPAVGVRRSGRSAGVPAEIYVPELTTAASATWGRPDRKEGPLSFAETLGLTGASADGEEEEGTEEKEGAGAAMEDEGEESKQSSKGKAATAAAAAGSTAAAAGSSKPASFSAEVESVLSALNSCLKLSTPAAVAQASSAVVASYGQKGALGLGQMRMAGEGVKIIKSRATVLSFHPTAAIDSSASIVAVGDKEGNVSLARYSNKAAQKDWAATVQVARFAPHTQSVVGLLWGSAAQSHNLYSASQDGSVRRMDLETQQWLEAYVAPDDGDGVSAVCMAPDYSALYCGDRGGVMRMVDLRAGSQMKHSQHTLSTHKLNGLAVNPLDGHMLASCGNERKVRVWDVRNLSKELREWTHGFSVNAVSFSPSGRMMATTSYDDTIKLMSCVNSAGALLTPTQWGAEKIIKHNNHTGRWVTTFRTMFAPADAAIAIGNMQRAIDVFTFPTVDSAAIAAASPAFATAAAAPPSNGNGKKQRGAGAAAAAAAAASSSSSSSSSASFSKSGPSAPAPQPSSVMSLTHGEYVTSIPSAVAWEPNRVAVAGVTSSGRLYVFGHFGK